MFRGWYMELLDDHTISYRHHHIIIHIRRALILLQFYTHIANVKVLKIKNKNTGK